MSLREQVAAETKAAGRPCSVETARAAMPKEEGKELVELLADPGVQHTALSRVLRRLGHDVSEHSIMQHRRGACRCAKS